MSFKRLRALLALGLALGLGGCPAVGTPGSGAGGAATALNPSGEPTGTSVAAANGGATDVMAPVSDHSESQGDEMMDKLTTLQPSYPSLRLPKKFVTYVGPQLPNVQTLPEETLPQAEWKDDCWEESITLNIQALDWVPAGEGGDYRHEDLKGGPYVRIVTAQPSTDSNNEFDWSTANYWDVPLVAEIKDGLVSNVRTVIHRAWDTDILLFMYYRPPTDATSTVDFKPTPFPDPADCDPNAALCQRRGFETHEAWEQFIKDPSVFTVGRYLMNIDENHSPCIVKSFIRSSPPPNSPPPDFEVRLLTGGPSTPPETQPETEPSLKEIILRPPVRINRP